jgi:hypothetical protein
MPTNWSVKSQGLQHMSGASTDSRTSLVLIRQKLSERERKNLNVRCDLVNEEGEARSSANQALLTIT